ncbi:polyneuridine-aldehyde esterase-like [Vicia villosa]|uniref:polyneuridine-aldehyde esterase-like n=1 Tax=Vicia villosa TaxID=3911 RepID=UPI00273B944C|nr:polyneuridine-aldehyde esterase-like [Vicia villosa]
MSEFNMNQKQQNHFVLVHGICMGAWCWYKLKPQLESIGHKVTALDLAACGINTQKIEDVHTFADYAKPLLEFFASLDPKEKVILVGHSFGGMSIALAMEKFPEKVAIGIFIAAFIPDTLHQPSYVLQQNIERYPVSGWLDTEISYDESKMIVLPGLKLLSTKFFQLCSTEDFELLKTLRRRGSLFIEDLSEVDNLSKERYESVPRAYIVADEDLAIPVEFQEWMIQNAGIDVVNVMNGADHMAMLSKPQELCLSLLDIVNKYVI